MRTFTSALLAASSLMGVSVLAGDNTNEADGPTLQVRGEDFMQMTITTDWVRERDSSLDDEE